MRKFFRSIELLAFAGVVLAGYSDAALAQTLTLNPSSIGFTIPGPGGTGAATYSVSATNGATITSIFVSPINTTSGGSWLTGPASTISGNQFTLNVGNTANLAPNSSYQGTVGITATTPNGNISATFNATLTVGNMPGSSGTSSALTANPSSITFSESSSRRVRLPKRYRSI